MERRHKRKERGGSEDRGFDGGDKRAKVFEEGRKERKRFDEDEKDIINGGHRERRRFEDRRVKEEEGDDYDGPAVQGEEMNTSDVKNVKREEVDCHFDNSQSATGTANGSGLVGNVSLLSFFSFFLYLLWMVRIRLEVTF